jgi:hypothetical protein
MLKHDAGMRSEIAALRKQKAIEKKSAEVVEHLNMTAVEQLELKNHCHSNTFTSELEKLSVPQLQLALRKLGKFVTGRKESLVERLGCALKEALTPLGPAGAGEGGAVQALSLMSQETTGGPIPPSDDLQDQARACIDKQPEKEPKLSQKHDPSIFPGMDVLLKAASSRAAGAASTGNGGDHA